MDISPAPKKMENFPDTGQREFASFAGTIGPRATAAFVRAERVRLEVENKLESETAPLDPNEYFSPREIQ